MKKILLICYLLSLVGSSINAHENRSDWKEKAKKYSYIAAKTGFAGLCANHLKILIRFGSLTSGDKNKITNLFITFVAGATAVKSVLDDLSK